MRIPWSPRAVLPASLLTVALLIGLPVLDPAASGAVPAAPLEVAAATTAPGTLTSLPPARLLDTRSGVGAPAAAVAPSTAVALQVAGRGGVPSSGVSAVVLNVTVTQPATKGFVTAYASGSARPASSNLNFVAGQTVPI